jgi:regulator of protease activity HflC (stomatin/prohibitin superfamily)
MAQKVTLEKDIEVTTSSPDDPRLKKRWGQVAAFPSEYLIHFRRGRLSEKTSGQGARCFKWWNDTTFIIPTSLKEIIFEANQLTRDNVDVRIRGMAVYRISDPLKIYKLINFSHRQSAEEKLARMIGDMCRSTSKWLVANMNVDECIRKRKEDIADALKKEVSSVVSDSQNGWGVEIVTIDIQDVFIQDKEIFDAMQMLFKTEKIRESKLAQMETERNLEMRRLEQEREIAENRKTTELNKTRIEAEIQNEQMETKKNLEVKKLSQARELSEHQKTTELNKTKNEAEITDEKIRLSKQNEEKQFELDKYRVAQNEDIAKYKLAQEVEREKQKIQLNLEKAQKDVEAQALRHQEEVNALQAKIQAENTISPLSLEKYFIEEALPAIAEATARSLKGVKITMFQQDGEGKGTPFNFILTELLQIFRDRMEPLRHREKEET